MNWTWSSSEYKSFSSRPLKSWTLIFLRNSSKNKIFKFSTVVPTSWISDSVAEKTKFSGSSLFSKEVTPLKPLTQFSNVILVLLSY